jgi:putative SOS response-associated peptidase YedK
MSDRIGNLPLMPGIYPDYRAPVVRNQSDGRELTMARWGMPSPRSALKTRNADSGVTNIRNVKSPHWRRWLGVEHRCVAPASARTKRCRTAASHRCDSPSMRRGRSPSLPASGPTGPQ